MSEPQEEIVFAGARPDRAPRYERALREVGRALAGADGLDAAVALLEGRFEHYSWVGYYRVAGDELVLGPWRGPEATEHVRIPVGSGICGAAAASGAVEIVDDVDADRRYLACFLSTRSEIVVPVVRDGRVVGEIDVDSDRPGAFGADDRAFLERVAALVARVPAAGGVDDGWIVEECGRESFPASDPPARWAGRDLGGEGDALMMSLEPRRQRSIDEPVNLTRIYTRAGDAGSTSLGSGARVSKADARVEAYGAVDELNAAIGVAVAALDEGSPLRAPLRRIQNELFDLGADLAVPQAEDGRSRLRIEAGQVHALETLCDELNARLTPLRSFVLPGGGEAAARLHVARTVCRRAERRAAALAEREPANPAALAYLNRLGDLLFVLARVASLEAGAAETLWRPGASTSARAGEGIFA